LGRRPLGAILHSSNEPGELSQWLCNDDSTLNIVVLIIIIIIIITKSTLSKQSFNTSISEARQVRLTRLFAQLDTASKLLVVLYFSFVKKNYFCFRCRIG